MTICGTIRRGVIRGPRLTSMFASCASTLEGTTGFIRSCVCPSCATRKVSSAHPSDIDGSTAVEGLRACGSVFPSKRFRCVSARDRSSNVTPSASIDVCPIDNCCVFEAN